MRKYKHDKRIYAITMGTKYTVSIVFIVLAISTKKTFGYMPAAFVELMMIAALTNVLAMKKPVLANIFNGILVFLFNIQMAVLFFAGSYIQMIMLSNLDSIKDISGNAAEYIAAVIVIAFTSFLPVCAVGRQSIKHMIGGVIAFLMFAMVEVGIFCGVGTDYSPFANYALLIREEYLYRSLRQSVGDAAAASGGESYFWEFWSYGVDDYRKKDAKLPETPNIILIFTEGLSQSIIDDDRNIMSNIAEFERASLNFTGYYNHTFATYRGLIGQLYSGYQMDNFDENCLISMQSILSDAGYSTAFVNTEPYDEAFTAYVNLFGFDEVVGSTDDVITGAIDSYSDREAYGLLYDTAETLFDSGEPFFISVYTFGTHATLDSPDEVFGDGSVSELNKFYNLDVWFGEFLDKFKKSSMAENTVIVFTADHATYQDREFTETFPDYVRTCPEVDEIPLCIWYAGIEPETVEADGRNSLDLAPTILDWLDISAPNCFLGESLFAPVSEDESFDTIFCKDGVEAISTKNGEFVSVNIGELSWFREALNRYFVVKRSSPSDEYLTKIQALETITAILSSDGQSLEVIYTDDNSGSYSGFDFSVWSEENGQDDMIWYEAEKSDGNQWRVVVPLTGHTLQGELMVYIYGITEQDMEFVYGTSVSIW